MKGVLRMLGTGLVLSLGILAPAVVVMAAKAPQMTQEMSAVSVSKININTATLDELQAIRGIGPKLAERILEFRSKNGSFKSLEDIVQVQGIGSVKFEKIKDQLTL